MPGENCCVVGCGSCRRHKGLGIFKLPAKSTDENDKSKNEDWNYCSFSTDFQNKRKTNYVPVSDIAKYFRLFFSHNILSGVRICPLLL